MLFTFTFLFFSPLVLLLFGLLRTLAKLVSVGYGEHLCSPVGAWKIDLVLLT